MKGYTLIRILVFFSLLQLAGDKFYGKQPLSILKSIDEVFCAILIIVLFLKYKIILKNYFFKYFIMSILLFTICGLISSMSYAQGFSFLNGLIQLILDLKFFIFVISLLTLAYEKKIISFTDSLFKNILLLNIPMIIFQYLNVNLYNSIFDTANNTLGDFKTQTSVIPRALGVFWHSGQLATFCVFSAIFFAYICLNKKYFYLSVFQLLLTLQRQEIATFMILIIFFYFFKNKKIKYKSLQIISFTILSLIGIVTNFKVINSFLLFNIKYSAADNLSASEDPRIVFYVKACKLANTYYPFGNGLGTFGGYTARIFKSKTYKELHFDEFWWYNENLYLTDNYYPHIIGEYGYLGVSFLILSFFFLYKIVCYRVKDENLSNSIKLTLLYVFLVCLTSPIINEFLIITFALLIICCATSLDKIKYYPSIEKNILSNALT